MHLTNFHFYNTKNYLYSKPVKGLRSRCVGIEVGCGFAFNGQEKGDEVSGVGNTMTAEFWEYDTRLGRRFNRDPKPNHFISEYVCFANNPIFFKDPEGDTIRTSLYGSLEKWPTKLKAAGDYKKRYDDDVFVFTLHGSEKGIQIGKPKVTKPDGTKTGRGIGKDNQYFEQEVPEIYSEFAAACPEFKNALEKGKKITIILQSCHTGDGDNPIAQKIADYNSNVTVVAPNGFISVWDNYVRTNDDDNSLDENGKFKRYKGTGFYSIFRKDKEVEPIKKPINLN
ncbi:MAG: hypothetical protein ACEQSR_01140 [Candidatus Methylacidiphilales bacterium]